MMVNTKDEMEREIIGLRNKNSSLINKLEIMERTHNLKRCWLCGTSENLTKHHFQMKRKRNGLGTMPLCRPCHNEVEETRKGMKTFFRRYYKEEYEKQVKGLIRRKNYWKNKYEKLKNDN